LDDLIPLRRGGWLLVSAGWIGWGREKQAVDINAKTVPGRHRDTEQYD